MKKYAIFGAGMMGRVVAKDMLDSESDAEVSLYDASPKALGEATELLGGPRFTAHTVDARETAEMVRALRGKDAAIGALPHGLSFGLVEAAVEAGTSLVDLVGSGSWKRAPLHQRAREAGCLIIPGCGVAPGVSNMCIGRGAELLDEAHTGVIYVGGIPKVKAEPLFYQTVYLMESVLNAYGRDATIVVNKKEVKVPPLSGLETLSFPEPIGELEAFYTDGLASLPITMSDAFEDKLYEKTLRYPGHAERVQLLKACGLLDEKPVVVGDATVSPRELLLKLLEDDLRLGPEGDILAMRIVVEGTKGADTKKHTFELIDYMDPETKYTAMARTTGFPAACAARMIAGGELTDTGVLFPEQVFLGQRFEKMIAALAAKGVKVTHEETP